MFCYVFFSLLLLVHFGVSIWLVNSGSFPDRAHVSKVREVVKNHITFSVYGSFTKVGLSNLWFFGCSLDIQGWVVCCLVLPLSATWQPIYFQSPRRLDHTHSCHEAASIINVNSGQEADKEGICQEARFEDRLLTGGGSGQQPLENGAGEVSSGQLAWLKRKSGFQVFLC